MSVGTNSAPATEFEFTLEEQWAIHAAFLDYVEVALRDDTELPKPVVELTILEKVEEGNFSFTAFELDRLRYECEDYANSDHAADIDRKPARTVVKWIEQQCVGEIGR